MAACTFFGHADTSEHITRLLEETVIDLIEKHNVTSLYVGNHGNFDRIATAVLRRTRQRYPIIRYTIVLAYLPTGDKTVWSEQDETLYPEGIETVPKRFAIVWRNRWMIENSDYVITHVHRPCGGAAKFKELAQKQHKTVINLV